MFLVGRKADQTDVPSHYGLVEINGLEYLVSGENAFKDAIAANYGGVGSDYSVLEVVSDVDKAKINDGDEFDLVWASDEITGVDFALEDAKRIVDFVTDKDIILGNGGATNMGTANIEFIVYENDGTTPATSVTSNKVLPVQKGRELVYARAQIVNGSGTFTITGTEGKTWAIPAVNKIDNNNIRVRTIANVTVLEPI